MKLVPALDVAPGDIVAFVGGGGKTTAMFQLAGEIVAAGGRVVVSTTTRIFAAQVALAPAHVMVGEHGLGERERAAVAEALDQHGQVLVTGAVDAAEGKALGVVPDIVAALHTLPARPTVLIEADGSRMRPFKAPAGHEPVIPDGTTLVVPVVGADVFGAPLGPERVHRPELVAALASAAMGTTVGPDLVARVLTHPEGGLKGVPPGARVIPLINKVESEAALSAARETAERLLNEPRILGVALGTVRTDEPVREAWGRVAAVVLAAGRSSRMGQPKPVLAWGQGRTLLSTVVGQLRASPVAEIVVVTGLAREAVEASLSGLVDAPGPRLRWAHNPDFAHTEMARSLQVGMRAVAPGTQAVLVALADQPDLDSAVAAGVIQRWRETRAAVVAPYYHSQRGHPLLFDRSVWPALQALPASANPRAVLEQAGTVEQVEVFTSSVLRDIDTPEDYAAHRPAGV